MWRLQRSIPVLFAYLATLFVVGTAWGQTDSKTVTKPEAKQNAATPGGKVKPLSDEECLKFAGEVTQAIETQDFERYQRLLDFDAILETATAGVPASDAFRVGFIDGAKKSLQGQGSLFHRILMQTKQGGSYTFLHLHRRNNRTTALFRLVSENNEGLNHHEYILVRRSDGSVRAVDIYIHLAGEAISQTFRRFYVPTAAETSRGLLARLVGSEQDLAKSFPKIHQMSKDMAARKFQEILNTYSELPESVQKDKIVLILRIQAAQGTNNDEAYTAAIKDFRRFHPQDSCVDRLSIDYYLLKKQYAESLACVDRLDKALGGDPYLELVRAGIHRTAKDLDEAAKAAKRAVEREPNLSDGYATQLSLSLQRKKFDETVAALEVLKERFGVKFNDLTTIPVYADFVKSPQFQEWKALEKKDVKGEEAEEPGEKKADAPSQ